MPAAKKGGKMKEFIKMNTVILAVCILALALLVFPLNSFAKGGKGGKSDRNSLVCASEGNIDGLEFDFGDGFPLDLGGGLEATIVGVEVKASGQETTVITPANKYIYNAILSAGWIDPQDGVSGFGKLDAIAILNIGKAGSMDVILESEFVSANLFEQFKIKKRDIPDSNADKFEACADLLDVTVPKKVDLFFEVKQIELTGITDLEGNDIIGYLASEEFDPEVVQPFNLILVIDKGKLVLVDNTFEFFIP
jgi:hypothetical protein